MARTKKSESVPVRIRFKKLENGNQSVYLDIYQDRKRHYEFLKLYLIPETNVKSREQNENTMKAANAVKAQRILDLTNKKAPAALTDKAKVLLVDWLDEFSKRSMLQGKRSTQRHVQYTMLYLHKYNDKIRLGEVDKEYITGFIDFLSEQKSRRGNVPLSKGTIKHLVSCVCASLTLAVEDGILSVNPAMNVDKSQIQGGQFHREYLTIEEVQRLIDTPCKRDDIKTAFLFACFCGLRISDIRALQWKDIIQNGDDWHMEIRQTKTQRMLYLPMNQNARKWLPKRGDASAEDKVFQSTLIGTKTLFDKWMKAAKVTKKVSFHVARHTFATMELTMGADLYTTSQLLGHTNVTTTQVYAKVIDTKKDKAVFLIDKLFE